MDTVWTFSAVELGAAVPGQFTLGWSPGWGDSSLEMTLSCTCYVTVDGPLPFSGPWRGFDPKYEEMKEPPSDPVSTHRHPQPVRSRDSFTFRQMALQSLSLRCKKRSPWGLSIGSSSRVCFHFLVAQILQMLREGNPGQGTLQSDRAKWL